LYYNIADFSVWDYTHGFDDVRARVLRLIGNPETRYREDPVRMLRAMRFAAKLDFELAPETAAPIATLGDLLRDVRRAFVRRAAQALQSGYAEESTCG
jgi:poly(A) polymerase